jgi:hypothetical protein
MNAPQAPARTLPRYGIREDEMTRPGVVLFDWDGDDEATVRIEPFEPTALDPVLADAGLDDDIDVNMFRPHWRGIGRRPGTVALSLVLGVSVIIGICAIFTPAEAQSSALSAR